MSKKKKKNTSKKNNIEQTNNLENEIMVVEEDKKETEEVVEEVETLKISDELVEYLAFARCCKSQMCQFFNEIEDRNVIQTVKDSELERFGVDTSLPIGINVGFSKENMLERFEELKNRQIFWDCCKQQSLFKKST